MSLADMRSTLMEHRVEREFVFNSFSLDFFRIPHLMAGGIEAKHFLGKKNETETNSLMSNIFHWGAGGFPGFSVSSGILVFHVLDEESQAPAADWNLLDLGGRSLSLPFSWNSMVVML